MCADRAFAVAGGSIASVAEGGRSVTAGIYEFLSALSEGRTVGEAIGRGTANAPDFDLIECFNALISADVVVGLQLSQDRP